MSSRKHRTFQQLLGGLFESHEIISMQRVIHNLGNVKKKGRKIHPAFAGRLQTSTYTYDTLVGMCVLLAIKYLSLNVERYLDWSRFTSTLNLTFCILIICSHRTTLGYTLDARAW